MTTLLWKAFGDASKILCVSTFDIGSAMIYMPLLNRPYIISTIAACP